MKIYSLIAVAALVIVLIVGSIPQPVVSQFIICQGTDPTFTFYVNGITGSSSSPVLTVDGIDYFPDAFPLSFNWANGSTHNYQWWETVTTSAGKFSLSEVSGFSNETSLIFVMPDENCSITANYTQTHAKITFNVTGLGDDVPESAVVLTLEGVDYILSQMPISLYIEINRTITYVFVQQIQGYNYTYVTTHCEGLTSEIGGGLTVTQSGSITAIYGTGNRTITFSAEFPENLPDQVILTVDGIDITLQDLPIDFTWQYGSIHQYVWINSLTDEENNRYRYVGCGGLADEQSGVILVEISGEIHAVYSSTPQAPEEEEETAPGGWGSIEIGQGTGTTATRFAAQNHVFFAKNRYWCFYVNAEGKFGYKTYRPGGTVSDFIEICDDVHSTDGQYIAVAYEPERENVHFAKFAKINTYPYVYYRMGHLNDDGSISWATENWQSTGVRTYYSTETITCLAIAVSTDGYPFIVIGGHLVGGGYSAGYRLWTGYSQRNDGVWNGVGTHITGTSSSLLQYLYADICRLKEGRMLVVFHYSSSSSSYKIRYKLFDGGWSSRYEICSFSSSIEVKSLSLASYENTAVLSYLHSDGIHLHRFVYGQGWSVACTISENFDTESYPTSTMIDSENAEVFWGYGSVIYRAEYNITANTIANLIAIYGQENLDSTSLNALEYRVNDHAGLLYVHQVDSAKVHLLFYPYASAQRTMPPQFILPILPIIGLIGIILMIISPTMMIKKIREKDFDRALDFFVYLLIGFALFLAWAIGV